MHKSVLLNECIKYLNLKDDSIIVDATLGYAGHSSNILKNIPNGYLYAFDQDEEAIKNSSEKLKKIRNNYEIISSNFVEMKKELENDKTDFGKYLQRKLLKEYGLRVRKEQGNQLFEEKVQRLHNYLFK